MGITFDPGRRELTGALDFKRAFRQSVARFILEIKC